MTLPVRTLIFQGYKTALDAIAPQNLTDPVRVYRERRLAISENTDRLVVNLVANDDADIDDTISSDGTFYREQFTVEGHVTQADTDEQAADDLTDLYAATVVAIMADTGVGNLAIDTRQAGAVFDLTRDPGTAAAGSFVLTMEVDYRTVAGDPYTPAP